MKADKARKPCHLRNLDQGVVIIITVVYTAVFLLSKKELLQCLTKTKSVFCMFSRANIRRNGSLQMSCPPSAACRWVAGYISSVRNLQERTPILS